MTMWLQGLMVNRLRRHPFTVEWGVRFPLRLPRAKSLFFYFIKDYLADDILEGNRTGEVAEPVARRSDKPRRESEAERFPLRLPRKKTALMLVFKRVWKASLFACFFSLCDQTQLAIKNASWSQLFW